jgi:hypothetical protein
MNNLLSRVVGEDIEILVELTPNLWPVIADPSQVEASIVNLAPMRATPCQKAAG